VDLQEVRREDRGSIRLLLEVCDAEGGCSSRRSSAAERGAEGKKTWRMAYKYFRGTLASWDELFDQAAQFATEIGTEYVVGISHSADRGDGVVTVWYWTQAEP